ncbi:hypothetical protein [Nocardia pseudobrasiliensis]|uniref:ABC transporter permease n=1 Tax=Nocardia pseudobrasiliensis TaxID=45979 RepID=A0A370HZX6_9NOCA|nr:hypothetical protein [Nocardia pseudobrasiliensis]RDI64018.1 hypothetical protein DFR76_109358 [Nocardia pseudobrasiliensis]
MNATSRAIAVGLAAAVLQAVMLIAFAWPAARIAPRDLPIVVAGPQASLVAEKMTQHDPDAFEVTTVADEAAARSALERRDAYGAIVTGGGQPRLLVASASSPVAAQLITQIGQQISGAPAAPVQDVVAADSHDPRGAGFGAMVLPLVMAGLAAGVLLSLSVPVVGGRVLGLLTFAVVSGLLSMSIVQGWLQLLPGSYVVLAAIAGLVSFTVAGTVVGLYAVLGRAGIGVAAALLMLIGNPFSAATSAPELLPKPWGALGQLLPPGAAATLLRSAAFFDGRAIATPLTVLFTWAAAALALSTVAALRPRAVEPTPVTA